MRVLLHRGSIFHLILLSVTAPLYAQVEFESRALQIGQSPPRGVCAVDLDQDGLVDILGVYPNEGILWWIKNEGEQIFNTIAVTSEIGGLGGKMAVADYNGDGNLDIAICSTSWPAVVDEGYIFWFEFDGEQGFTPHLIAGNYGGAFGADTEDMDNDGDFDIATIAYADGQVTWWENDGEGDFTEHMISGNVSGPYCVEIADINGDNHFDVVATAFTGNDIIWWENDGSMGFDHEHFIVSSMSYASQIVVVDLDQDGDNDIISTAEGSDILFWWEQFGNVQFESHLIAYNIDRVSPVITGDFTDDGFIDIACGGYADGSLVLFINDGMNDFTANEISDQEIGINFIDAADFDGDYDLDLVASTEPTAAITLWNNQLFHIPDNEQEWFKNDGNPVFSLLGEPDSWNSVADYSTLILPRLFRDVDSEMLYYGGYDGETWSIGLAESPSLREGWTEYPDNPVLTGTPGEWDEAGAGNGWIIREQGLYSMWYAGMDSEDVIRIGYANSVDGITWMKYVENPVFDVMNGEWDSDGVLTPCVLYIDDMYHMAYTGFHRVGEYEVCQIGYAISEDGLNWQRVQADPIIEIGCSSEWDELSCAYPFAMETDTDVLLWYLGSAGDGISTGFASSTEGIEWIKSGHNPVLTGDLNMWDSQVATCIQVNGNRGFYEMLYFGADNEPTFTGLGHAVSVPWSSTRKDSEILLPLHSSITGCYPNPFNSIAHIEFQLQAPAQTRLSVYNLLGQQVTVLTNSFLLSGNHHALWNATDLSSGAYFLILQGDGIPTSTARIHLVK